MKKTHIFVLAGLAALATSSATVVATKTNIGGSSSSFGVNDNVSNTGEEINPTPSNDEGSKESSPANSNPNELAKYTVTFDFNGGTCGDQSTLIFTEVVPTTYFYYLKQKITGTIVPPAPSEYRTLAGYSLSPNDSTNLIRDTYVIRDNNLTFYAQYGVKPNTQSTVNWYDPGQFHEGTATLISSEKYFIGETPVFKDQYPIHSGYTFDSWTPAIAPITEAGQTIEYTAVYTNSKAYTVTLDYNNPTQNIHEQKVADGGFAVEPQVTYLGHNIKQWNIFDGGTGTFTFNTPITGNIKIRAEWQPDTCNITYVANGGTITASTTTAPYGGTIESAPTLDDRGGYDKTQVTWWTTDTFNTGTQFTFGAEGTGTEVTGDLTLFAKWPNIKTSDYSFYDGDTPIATIPTQTVKYGERVQRPANPTKDGYNFSGWYKDAGFQTSFDFDATATCEEETVKVYAKFTAVTHRVTLNPNGGTITGQDVYTVSHGATIETAPVVTNGDYAQPTWYTTPNFETDTEFDFGAEGTGTSVTQDLTLYAKYSDIKAGDSFVDDSWKIFTNEIKNKTFEEIITDSAYKDDYEAQGNTFVGLTRSLDVADDTGYTTTYTVTVVDEHPDAGEFDTKFNFMFTFGSSATGTLCDFDRADNNYFYSDLKLRMDQTACCIDPVLQKGSGLTRDMRDCYDPTPGEYTPLKQYPFILFAPSSTEIFGTPSGDAAPIEGTQFKLFQNADTTTIASLLGNTWLRTPNLGTEGTAYYVDADGNRAFDSITAKKRVCAVFGIR